MNIISLHTFLAIVETGSLVRASEKMNVTQSTVTARLKTLEQDLGQVLLHRHKSGVSLTPAGTKLLRYAKIMTGLWRQARHEAGLPAGTEAVFAFGCHQDLWDQSGKSFFDRVAAEHAEMGMSVYQGSQQELEDWLVAGLTDVVLTYEPIARGNNTIYELPPEELVLYSDRHDCPTKFDPGYIFVDHGEGYRRWHGEVYYDAGTARITFSSARWALKYLLENGGSAYLPSSLTQQEVQEKTLFAIEAAEIFLRKKYLIVNEKAEQNWPWFERMIDQFKSPAVRSI